MKTLNLDELASVSYPPVSFILDGKTYTVKNITADMLDKVRELEKDADNRTICRMLAVLTGEIDVVFCKADFRKVVRALKFITETTQKQLEVDPKNSEAEAN